MANQPSPTVEELQLRKRARRRLIGAITLVVLMVTVLPMILDDEPKPVGQDIAINIPSPQSTGTTFKASPAPVPSRSLPAEIPPPVQLAAPTESRKPIAAVEKAELEPKPKPAPVIKPQEAKPVAKAPEPQQAGGGSYVVLLGAFLGEANAIQRQAKLKEAGVKYYVEKIKSPAGEKTAVRAGPYPSRQEAEHVLAKLKTAGIQDGMVAEKK
ncbi:MAG: SPOR domain-containing protein [Gammaproteobacteria bacterium]|nr:SPOR domain-containing protein [Gammaproteobacteria bacterium]MBU1732709.1 SPOR domain-containing protein [Gammaproteobacteria bacterium]MBU1891534.1 SPOR domain-containing protein [Gammaproteobacteria bacterium]